MNPGNSKNIIEANFSRASQTYDSYSRMQKKVSDLLLSTAEPLLISVPPGAVLEIGCGTGHMSCELVRIAQERKLVFTDISPEMVSVTEKKVQSVVKGQGDFEFKVSDAESMSEETSYAVIISGLTVQWFTDFQATTQKLYNALIPGGELLLSCLVEGSFSEWKSICEKISLPCTANTFYKSSKYLQRLNQVFDDVEIQTQSITIDYPNATYFFRSLKQTGTNTQKDGTALSAGQMRKLIRFWDNSLHGENLKITYVVNFIRAKKNL